MRVLKAYGIGAILFVVFGLIVYAVRWIGALLALIPSEVVEAIQAIGGLFIMLSIFAYIPYKIMTADDYDPEYDDDIEQEQVQLELDFGD